MATKAAVKNILPEIPITLAVLMGDIVIRFGELERVIFTAMARVKSTDSSENNEESEYINLVGKYKEIKTLGKLAEKAREEFKKHQFQWFDVAVLKRLSKQRNAIIHDALVEEANGTLIWQASGRRKHRPIDYGELLLLRECVVRTIQQINKGSLDYKKSHS